MFSKILIANRGEIAVRIIRACKEMGIATVAVFSEADRDALHVSLADESICIGPSSPKDSYLNMSAILSAAVVAGAEAIHPGYGLLSENARFAQLCEECGIVFIGPSAEVIRRMGDKDEARKTMKQAGVPVTPGCDVIEDVKEAKKEAERIGFPLLVKARSGGGGRGIRLVHSAQEFEAAFKTASAEAKTAFGDGAVYMERFLSPAKHIEMQILCDKQGNVISLGERECSIQRKNQKLIEESPSPSVSVETRNKMIEVAAKAAKTVRYENAGTIEFLMSEDGSFYFMEMNTRLQVEHTVTEMVTGIDLVKWQIRIAAGIPLDMKQEEIQFTGSAIECRINAEDPSQNFRPCAGRIDLLHIPGGPWVRFDTAIYQDYVVPPFYDSMIGKLIVHAKTREEAIRKMRAALCELIIGGIATNTELQLEILEEKDFVKGDYYTNFMERREKRG
ncbi:acetyl-CoA carboxylase biotin carboxylase subunit [Sinanaerobacter sp. ZZT-01]|uniref:acetyl-CoA carboxylase biotin carboxylase subunit n=1 Tax=Sinanaerobacter sp. ZZT-01 TaxID=3111540 RepID=UPI002D796A7F|nr:acetyl-CoA carboxylase biotin carboxylase subunit [Sinanaerobacter sp. ZZT-01]WRR92101.1 acetyl-CoA carboxylase biotin carboxylase subunit [Sinanaerobacter sp. ZZT-01]